MLFIKCNKSFLLRNLYLKALTSEIDFIDSSYLCNIKYNAFLSRAFIHISQLIYFFLLIKNNHHRLSN